jgi:hypothetical protein
VTAPQRGTQPTLSATVHTVAKLGRDPADNEDSAAVDLSSGRFAVADGASTSARPEVWSRLLVQAFVSERIDPLVPAALAQLRGRWNTSVMRPGLAWYAQAKLLQGADSTFLGLYLDRKERLYHATVVGDSCLFHLRHHDLVWVGPVEQAADFSRFPDLISSRPGAPPPKATALAGTYRRGDTFLLATDAIAKFLLAVYERYGRVPAEPFAGDTQEFRRGVARYRNRGQLGNDDTTLCVVRV